MGRMATARAFHYIEKKTAKAILMKVWEHKMYLYHHKMHNLLDNGRRVECDELIKWIEDNFDVKVNESIYK